MTGVVTRIYPLQGEAVKPGQPLFEIRLTHEDLLQKQTDFLRTVEELDVIDREVERLDKIAASGAIPGKSLLDRKYEQQKQLASLRAQRQALLLHGLSGEQVDHIQQERTLLQSLTLVTPSQRGGPGGPAETRFQIQELKVSQGSSVTSGSTLCRLVDHAQLYIEGQAFEDDERAVSQAAAQHRQVTAAFGTPGTEDAPTIPDLDVLYLDDRVDVLSRTFRFYVVLPNAIEREDVTNAGPHFIYWRFKPGQRRQIKVPVETWPERIVLPVAAVAQDGLDFYVFEANNGHFDRRTVHVEYRDQDWVVIANDGALQPGVLIADSAAHQMQLALKNKAGGASTRTPDTTTNFPAGRSRLPDGTCTSADVHALPGPTRQAGPTEPSMLNEIIRAALRYRVLTIAVALVALVYGGIVLYHLPIDVFPDLDRPRVTLMTEAHGSGPGRGRDAGHAPAGVGPARGHRRAGRPQFLGDRPVGDPGRIRLGFRHLPRPPNRRRKTGAGRRPPARTASGRRWAPISSVMGQIMIIGMWSEGGRTPPMEVRTLADWVVRQRLLTVPGIAQVITMGGGRKQYQVLVNAHTLRTFDVTLHDVERALAASNSNATGGYLNRGALEYLVRSVGRLQDAEDIKQIVVKARSERPVLLGQVARVAEAAAGAARRFGRQRRPGGDAHDHQATRRRHPPLDRGDSRALTELQATLPADLRFNPNVYQQKTFIELGIHNVLLALRDGSSAGRAGAVPVPAELPHHVHHAHGHSACRWP